MQEGIVQFFVRSDGDRVTLYTVDSDGNPGEYVTGGVISSPDIDGGPVEWDDHHNVAGAAATQAWKECATNKSRAEYEERNAVAAEVLAESERSHEKKQEFLSKAAKHRGYVDYFQNCAPGPGEFFVRLPLEISITEDELASVAEELSLPLTEAREAVRRAVRAGYSYDCPLESRVLQVTSAGTIRLVGAGCDGFDGRPLFRVG